MASELNIEKDPESIEEIIEFLEKNEIFVSQYNSHLRTEILRAFILGQRVSTSLFSKQLAGALKDEN